MKNRKAARIFSVLLCLAMLLTLPVSAESVDGTYAELKYGMRDSDEVRAMQTRLRELGYMSAYPSGGYFDDTAKAVADFQAASGFRTNKKTASPEMLGMGTTGVCAYVGDNGVAHIVHAGDSRAYLYHAGELTQITHDHSMVQQLVDSGQITREQAAQHPQKNLITRALGVSANIVPEYSRCQVAVGDILLLCTDGLTNMIPDTETARILRDATFFDATRILVDHALQAGGQDNITVLLMGVETTEVNHG